MLKYLKSVNEPKISHGGYPKEFAGSTQNLKKCVGTPNQPIRTKMFPKNMFSTLKV
jgi:hypothetical protein